MLRVVHVRARPHPNLLLRICRSRYHSIFPSAEHPVSGAVHSRSFLNVAGSKWVYVETAGRGGSFARSFERTSSHSGAAENPSPAEASFALWSVEDPTHQYGKTVK